MVITWYGGLCLGLEERIRGTEPRSAVLFPSSKESRVRTLEEKANVLLERGQGARSKFPVYTVTTAGEYDIAGFVIRGVEVGEGKEKPVAFVVESGDIAFCHVGGFMSEVLADRETDAIGVVDVLAVPFSDGSRSTAAVSVLSKIVHEIEPRIVLPLTTETKARTAIAKELGTEGERMSKLTISQKDLPEEGFRIVFLDPQ